MVNEIRIYVEGGGDGRDTKAIVRQGFSEFFRDLVGRARTKGIGWKIIACGTRRHAYDNFRIALSSNPTAFNVLLVDSEGLVAGQARQHLENRDGWNLENLHDEQCHLMVRLMEAWLLADTDALRQFYGNGFNANAIPRRANVEEIIKTDVEFSLKQATRSTSKGEYHKIRHGPKILQLLNVDKVRRAAPNCNRLFRCLYKRMES